MNEINKLPYAQWLEQSLQRAINEDIQAICILTKYVHPANDTSAIPYPVVESNYWHCNAADKLVFSGFIQQDAMLDALRADGYIPDDEDESEEEELENG